MPFVVCPCRPVLQRSSAAGRAPECGTLTVKPGRLILVSTASAPVGVGEWNLDGWVSGPEHAVRS